MEERPAGGFVVVHVRDDRGLDQGYSNEKGKKWMNWGHVLQIETQHELLINWV